MDPEPMDVKRKNHMIFGWLLSILGWLFTAVGAYGY